jgi:OHCU decarboxylase
VTAVAELDVMDVADASELLRSCCGSGAWVSGMLERRPFGTYEAVVGAADDVFETLSDADWMEAFAHHPRLGDARIDAPATAQSRAWSATEQSGVQSSPADIQAALAEANRAYESRHGRVCIIYAAGKSAAEILEITRARTANPFDVELRIAAGEQRKITRLRLRKLLATPDIQ